MSNMRQNGRNSRKPVGLKIAKTQPVESSDRSRPGNHHTTTAPPPPATPPLPASATTAPVLSTALTTTTAPRPRPRRHSHSRSRVWVGQVGRPGGSARWVGQVGRPGGSARWVGQVGRPGGSARWVGQVGRVAAVARVRDPVDNAFPLASPSRAEIHPFGWVVCVTQGLELLLRYSPPPCLDQFPTPSGDQLGGPLP